MNIKKHHQQKKIGFKHFIGSLRNALRGLSLLFHFEYNLYIQSTLGILAIILGFLLPISRFEWLSIIIVITLVIFAELTNTSIEKIMDFIQPDYDERVRDIKDLAAGAVLFVSFISLVVAVIIFIPKIIIFFI